ncbi:MAG: hypothetical protein COA79_24345 [Planctomycetota bacterium]|nr:MAG: hypothetical protein COA79_24345 [Planctomycetota bacterium]
MSETRNRSFKIDLVTYISGLLLLTVLIIIFYTYKKNSENTISLSKDLVNNVVHHALEKTNNYFKPAIELTQVTTSLLENEEIQLPNSKMLENHLIEILKIHPQINMYYVGNEKGNFIMAYRSRNGSITSQIINRTADKPYVEMKFRDSEMNIIETKRSEKIDFDPRGRPWYKGAEKNKKVFWTGIYPFFTSDLEDTTTSIISNNSETKFGLTISSPIYKNENEIWGVVGGDISINQLSQFLGTLKIGSNGKAFISNNANHLIAYPNLKYKSKNESDIMEINLIPDEWIKAGIQHYTTRSSEDFNFKYNSLEYIGKKINFPVDFGNNWFLVVMVPIDDFIGEIKNTHKFNLITSLVMLGIAIFLAAWMSKRFSRPIELLTLEMNKIRDFKLDEAEVVESPIKEIQQMSTALNSMRNGLKAFNKYVPATLVRQLIKSGHEVKLGGVEKNLTLFFSDIKDFTSISEKIAPMSLMLELSDYFDKIANIINDHQGTVDKYIGDAVMAFWGAPIELVDHAYKGCLSALLCQKKINIINDVRISEGKEPFKTRIGLHTGNVVVGNIGSHDRFNYTVLGDGVNLASRLEGLNKLYNTEIIVSMGTQKAVFDKFIFRPLDIIAVKGKSEGVKLFELIGTNEDVSQETKDFVLIYNEGFEFYLNREFEQARIKFEVCLNSKFDDIPTKKLLERCIGYIKSPPEKSWSGITRLDIKY